MSYLEHHGIKGQRWYVRRYQNLDGTLTPAGKKRAQELLDTANREQQMADYANKMGVQKPSAGKVIGATTVATAGIMGGMAGALSLGVPQAGLVLGYMASLPVAKVTSDYQLATAQKRCYKALAKLGELPVDIEAITTVSMMPGMEGDLTTRYDYKSKSDEEKRIHVNP